MTQEVQLQKFACRICRKETDKHTGISGVCGDCLVVSKTFTCADCGEVVPWCGLSPEVPEGYKLSELFCTDCISLNFIFCNSCECLVGKEEEFCVDGDYFCEDCFNENFTKCDSCGEVLTTEEVVYSEAGEAYCQRCYDDNYVRCTRCDWELPIDNAFYAPDCDDPYCDDCYYTVYSECDECGRVEYSDYMYYDDYSDRTMCRDCREDTTGIHNYNYVPTLDFKSCKRDKLGRSKTMYMGIEVEAENVKENDPSYVIAKEVSADSGGFLYCKHDGSIYEGFEVVSHPFTFNWLLENQDSFEPLFSLTKKGMRSYKTETCGMHVHLSKNAFTNLHLYRFLKLFYENPEFIAKVSNRKLNKLSQWARLNDDQSITYKAKTKSGYEKYTAVNCSPRNTVEVRIFRGTLSRSGFYKNVEFVQAAFEYTRDGSIKDVGIRGFMRYVVANRKRFSHLHMWLNRFYARDMREISPVKRAA